MTRFGGLVANKPSRGAIIMTGTKYKGIFVGAASMVALSVAVTPAFAEGERQFDIEAQPLAKALLAINEQSGLAVAAPRNLVEGKMAPAVKGEMEPEEALNKLLVNSGLKFNELSNGAYTITLASAGADEARTFRVAQVDQEDDVRGVGGKTNEEDEDQEEPDIIVVTGTSIKGVAPAGSPVTVFEREDILNSGQTTLSGFLRTIPQNLSSEISGLTGDRSIDLRGLGDENTLVLINGRRVSAGSLSGVGAADVSAIPSSMVERIEILPDGASAIYGADAVGGVVNIILRDDVRGAETDLLWGTSTQGGGTQYRASQSLGAGWGSGNAIVNYTFDKQKPVFNADREATRERGILFPGTHWLQGGTDHNVTLTARQELGDDLTAYFNGLYLTRDGGTPAQGTPDIINPFEAEQFSLYGGIDYDVSENWTARLTGSWSTRDNLSETLASATIFQSHSTTTSMRGEGSGPLFSLPGGSTRLALGAEWRRDDFTSDLTSSGISLSDIENKQNIWSGFGEFYMPLVSSRNDMPFVEAFNVSVAARYDSYENFGGEVVPKVGVDWTIVDGFKLRGSWGKSYRAPNLLEQAESDTISSVIVDLEPDPLAANPLTPGQSIILRLLGSTEVTQERSTNFTMGVDLSPAFIPGLDASVTYYSIDFEDRIAGIQLDLSNEEILADFINRRPNDAVGAAAFDAQVDDFLGLAAPVFVFDLRPIFGLAGEPVTVIGDERITNIAQTRSKGLDFDIGYRFETRRGDEFEARFAGNFIIEQGVRPVAAVPFTDDINKFMRPVDFRLRNQLSWRRSGVNVKAFFNYVDSYRNGRPFGYADEKVESWTTVDISAAYVADGVGLLGGTRFAVNVVNLFDSEPPFVRSSIPGDIEFDPVNASAMGRFVSIGVTKNW
ncbi:TonB-dependent receptor [Hyphococcus luteus]|uniref:Secretin/TonB short N-terminal domain-containing protein n=1 Tax=Hyphococcus luteus TaxID=2058213 RepID=A0A2S7KAS9_9PROT|nr:TonB-dependent receptor [Marinicaulis flavus]PQA89601.1 hypothetical protein CW354_01675 [Marinicaulis flavus]